MANYNTTKNFIYDLAATVFFLSTYYLMMPVFPIYMMELGIGKLTIGIIMGLFSISSMVSRPLGGIWVDAMGRRKLMFFSIALFFITPLFLNFPATLIGFSLAQLVYGFSIGAFTVAATTFAADISSSATVAQFMGFHSIACIAAKGLAPAIGVKLMEIYGFSGPVITTVILALVAGLFVFLLRDFETTTEKSQSYRFIEVLLKKNIYLPTLVLFCGLVTFGAISAMLPVFAKERGISGIEYFFVINTASVIIARLALGSWSKSYLESLVSTSLILLTVSFVSMSLVVNFHQLIAVSVIYGLGYALLFPMLSAILVLNVSPEYKGMALGIYTAAFDLGVAAGTVLGGLSQYVDFKYLYLILSLVPLAGFFLFNYAYLPLINRTKKYSGAVS
jgi:predicted MFS family arabinose efflux permease